MAEEVKKTVSTPVVEDDEHYEVVSEYRIGEGAPPPFLVICFILIFVYAAVSWIPFFGYQRKMSLSKLKLVFSNQKSFSPALRVDLKASLLLAMSPVVVGLTACNDSKVTLPSADDGLVSTKVTLGDKEPAEFLIA